MSPDQTPEESSDALQPRDRREAVREKALHVQAQQSRTRLIQRAALAAGVVGAVAVLAVVVMWAIGSSASRPQLSPQTAAHDGFVVTSLSNAAAVSETVDGDMDAEPAEGDATATPTPSPTPTAKPVVEIAVYVDFLSPAAREWQLANATQLSNWVSEGAVALSYHPVSMLTAKSNGTKYSLRAAGAAACVATHASGSFYAFASDLLTRQPAIDSDGFNDTELSNLAIAAGTDDPKGVRACIEDGSYLSWVKAATERAVKGIPGTDVSLTGTSMILVNGEVYAGAMGDAAEFSQFVLTSASGEFYKSQTPTPTPTPLVTPAP